MRIISLLKIAAEAEVLRLRATAERQGRRAALGAIAVVFALGAFRWRNDGVEESSLFEYGRTNEGEAAANWQQTPFYHLLISGSDELRRRIGFGEPADFPLLDQMKAEGLTDYLAFVHRF